MKGYITTEEVAMNVILKTTHIIESYPYDDGVLVRLLCKIANSGESWLKYIDLYDDTVFNSCQMTPLLAEWRAMKVGIQDEKELIAVEAIEKMLVKCSETDLSYIVLSKSIDVV